MITAKGLFSDFAEIDVDVTLTEYQKLGKKIEKLAKVILNCRTNTVKIMTKLEIPLDTEIKKEIEK